MLDCLSNGRLIAGFARGIPREYQVHNVPLAEFARAVRRGLRHHPRRVDAKRCSPTAANSGPIKTSRCGRGRCSAASAAVDADHQQQGIDRIGRQARHPDHAGHRLDRHAGRYHPLLRQMPRRQRPPHHAAPYRARQSAYVADSKAQAVQENGPYHLYFNRMLYQPRQLHRAQRTGQASGYVSSASNDYMRPENLRVAERSRADFRNMTMDDVERQAETMPWGTASEVTERIIDAAKRAGAGTVLLILQSRRDAERDVRRADPPLCPRGLPALHAHHASSVPLPEEARA